MAGFFGKFRRKPRVAVLMGGPSAEHEISLLSGEAMYSALSELGFPQPRSVVVRRDGSFSVEGQPVSALEAIEGVDAALLAFHGEWGEDGRGQALMEWLGVPYSGSGPIASSLAMEKAASRLVFRDHGLAVPKSRLYDAPFRNRGLRAFAQEVLRHHELPIVVKPACRGSSVGVSIVRTPDSLVEAVADALRYDTRILLEEYLDGMEVSCGVLEESSGELRALPVVAIIPPEHRPFFDYHAKYSGETRELVPAPLPDDVTAAVQRAALVAHRSLGCRHYSRTDIIVVEGTPVVLELNTLPGMTRESLLPKMAAAAGISFPELVERLVALAIRDGS